MPFSLSPHDAALTEPPGALIPQSLTLYMLTSLLHFRSITIAPAPPAASHRRPLSMHTVECIMCTARAPCKECVRRVGRNGLPHRSARGHVPLLISSIFSVFSRRSYPLALDTTHNIATTRQPCARFSSHLDFSFCLTAYTFLITATLALVKSPASCAPSAPRRPSPPTSVLMPT